jgi:phosphorylcholine metabolism protein LicD
VRSVHELSKLNNLTFPASFFEDEVREGFYITSMMKRYWASQLKVLSFIAQICDKHGLRWYAEYGSLLGAVRHGGYVPWDDDFDIVMLREDWERFFEVAEKELPENFKLLTIERNSEYQEAIGRIVNTGVIDFGAEHLKEYYGCPYTVGIDIFPLDGLYEDVDKEKDRVERAKKAAAKYNEVKSGLRPGNAHELLVKLEKIYKECPSEGAKKLALMPFYTGRGSHIFSPEWYEDTVELPFENALIKVPARYDEMLSYEYGDYLQVVKSGGVHEYPVYAGQEEILRENIGHNPYRYTLDPTELLRSVQRYVQRLTCGAQPRQKKIAVFLPCKTKWWSTMEPLWRKYSEDPNYEVHVLPIFYYDCNYNGEIGERHDERTLFPEYVPVEDCEKFDFETIHPDIIVTQVPYDGFSTFMTVHEFFYSANLLGFTDELIYVPCYDADAPEEKGDKAWTSLSVLVEQEAVINADRVIVESSAMRDFYVARLIEMCGEETRGYWEQKVLNMGDVVGEDTQEKCTEAGNYKGNTGNDGSSEENDIEESADKWNRFLGAYAGRKVIIYHISIAFLLRDREKSIDKIRRSLATFAESGDRVCAIIVPQKQILTDLERIDEDLWQQFQGVVGNISVPEMTSAENPEDNGNANISDAEGNTLILNCIYDEAGFSLDYMDKWSGYYGDADPLVRKCVLKGIPVMIENIEI